MWNSYLRYSIIRWYTSVAYFCGQGRLKSETRRKSARKQCDLRFAVDLISLWCSAFAGTITGVVSLLVAIKALHIFHVYDPRLLLLIPVYAKDQR